MLKVNGAGHLEVKFDAGGTSAIAVQDVELLDSEGAMKYTYEVTPTERGHGLTCPRPKCGAKFLLNIDKLRSVKERRQIKGVACPFCSRVSALPDPEEYE